MLPPSPASYSYPKGTKERSLWEQDTFSWTSLHLLGPKKGCYLFPLAKTANPPPNDPDGQSLWAPWPDSSTFPNKTQNKNL
jgi:hypothetical protein